jgi:hypothetical protein
LFCGSSKLGRTLRTLNGTYKKSHYKPKPQPITEYYDGKPLIRFRLSRKPENNGTPEIAKEAINIVAKVIGIAFSNRPYYACSPCKA